MGEPKIEWAKLNRLSPTHFPKFPTCERRMFTFKNAAYRLATARFDRVISMQQLMDSLPEELVLMVIVNLATRNHDT